MTAVALTFTSVPSAAFYGGIFNKIEGQGTIESAGKTGYAVYLADAGSDSLSLKLDAPVAGTASADLDSSSIIYISFAIPLQASGKLTLDAPVSVLPVSATPEPSSLILLGTGALGMAGAARRRFFPRA